MKRTEANQGGDLNASRIFYLPFLWWKGRMQWKEATLRGAQWLAHGFTMEGARGSWALQFLLPGLPQNMDGCPDSSGPWRILKSFWERKRLKMPIYEYLCPNCNFKFELLRHQSQANKTASCPRCHNGATRILSSFASFSKSIEGLSTPIGGSSPCSSCSATSCDTCQI